MAENNATDWCEPQIAIQIGVNHKLQYKLETRFVRNLNTNLAFNNLMKKHWLHHVHNQTVSVQC